jgi:hypothetical protein
MLTYNEHEALERAQQPQQQMAMAPIAANPGEIATTAAAAQAVAAVQARYALAVSRPRNMDQFRIDLLSDCRRPAFAEVARYSKPIGGSRVEGPSIRFVEAALRAYRNVMRETYIVYETAQTRVVRVALTDLENNTTHQTDISISKTVERSRVRDGQRVLSQRINSYGKLTYTIEATEDETKTKEAAQVSKAIRELGLRILPGDIVDEGQAMCIYTREKGIKDDPAAARKKLVDAFVSIGVQPTDLEKYLGCPVAQTQPKAIAELRQIYSSIAAGETTWRDVLEQQSGEQDKEPDEQEQDNPTVQAESKTAAVAAKIKQAK